MPTILITGCSSGFGLATARTFLARGWRVIATMRTPWPDLLPASERLLVLPLDVTDPASVHRLASDAGPIDALVNNAGVGLMGVFEGTPDATIRALFETNTFGPMAVTRAFLPQLRARGGGVVNVSSGTTLAALPLLAAYTASKAALNAFTESLALELEPLGVRVRLVLPGRSPETPFGRHARARGDADGVDVPAPYADVVARVAAGRASQDGAPVTHADDVAEAVWRAVPAPASPLRLPAGADALALAGAAA